MRPYPPLGTLYAASALVSAGHAVEVVDTTFMATLDEAGRWIGDAAPAVFISCPDLFNPVSKMCLGHMRQASLQLCRAAAEIGATTVAAGPDPTSFPEAYLEAGVDYVVVGEPETALVEFVGALGSAGHEAARRAVPGVAYLEDGRCVNGTARTPIASVDALPIPDRSLIDVQSYETAWRSHHGCFSLNIVASRGCGFACEWCAKPIWGSHYAARDPQAVVGEMLLLQEELGADHLWFCDDVFARSEDWLHEFEREVAAAGTRIPYSIQTRADVLTPAAADALARSGCHEVWLGAESGSQAVLDRMNKGLHVDDVRRATIAVKDAGMRACLFLQFGYPEENWDDITATVDLVWELMPDDIGVSVTYPLPGSRLYETLRGQIGDKANWTDSADLAMIFEGRYDSAFYRKLHDLLHEDLEARQQRTPAVGARSLAAAWADLERLATAS